MNIKFSFILISEIMPYIFVFIKEQIVETFGKPFFLLTLIDKKERKSHYANSHSSINFYHNRIFLFLSLI